MPDRSRTHERFEIDKALEQDILNLDTAEVKDVDLEVLFEHSPNGIAYVHRDGYFLRVNSRFCDLIGYNSSELVKRRRHQDVTHPDDVDADVAESERIAAGESDSYRMVKRYLHKRGNSVWVELQVTPARGKDGVMIHFVAHATQLAMAADFYRIEPAADGSAAIRPFYPLAKLVRDNWKTVVPSLTLLLGSIGTLGANYLAMREDTARQKETISHQQKQLEQNKAEITDLRGRLDRIDRK